MQLRCAFASGIRHCAGPRQLLTVGSERGWLIASRVNVLVRIYIFCAKKFVFRGGIATAACAFHRRERDSGLAGAFWREMATFWVVLVLRVHNLQTRWFVAVVRWRDVTGGRRSVAARLDAARAAGSNVASRCCGESSAGNLWTLFSCVGRVAESFFTLFYNRVFVRSFPVSFRRRLDGNGDVRF